MKTRSRIRPRRPLQGARPAFPDLVGYTEAEFQQALWPPVMARANLGKHRSR